MKALLVGYRPPDPHGSGYQKFLHYCAEALQSRGHSVETHWDSDVSVPVRGFYIVREYARGQPLQMGLTYSRKLQRWLRDRPRRNDLDLVVAIHARAANQIPVANRKQTIAFLIDSYAYGYSTYPSKLPRWLDAVYQAEQRRMLRVESAMLEQFARVVVVAERDRDFLRALATDPNRVVQVPHPLDYEYFAAMSSRPSYDTPVFAFWGRLDYPPNADAVKELALRVWPAISRQLPNARLRIVGAVPGRTTRRLLQERGIELQADVPDIRDHIADVAAMLAPMRMGSGIQVKVLEAMAAGIPVVCSGFAAAGTEASSGEQLLVADDPHAYAEAAVKIVHDRQLRQSLIESARRWVRETHSFARFADCFEEICLETASGAAAKPHSGAVATPESVGIISGP